MTNNDWHIFKGNGVVNDNVKWPDPPPWRKFTSETPEETAPPKDHPFVFEPLEIDVINLAIYLRRPILLTGQPGTGKSSMAKAVAKELNLGKLLHWPISTRSTLKEGLYYYDALRRLQDSNLSQNTQQPTDIGDYIRLGPLGTAFLPTQKPRILLIDEIDKSDIDLPNDLLNIFERGDFAIPELAAQKQDDVRVFPHDTDEKVSIFKGHITCQQFPLVFMTSNGERQFPPAFLRRCLQLETQVPDGDKLREIVSSWLTENNSAQVEKLIANFVDRRTKGDLLATDQLLNAVFLVSRAKNLLSHETTSTDLAKILFHNLKS